MPLQTTQESLTGMNTNTSQPIRLDSLIAEWLDIQDRITVLTERKETLAEQMRALGEGRHAATTGTITVSSGTRRFSAEKAAEILTPELREACTETVITSKRAKAVLPPALYDLCSETSGRPRITVKPATGAE